MQNAHIHILSELRRMRASKLPKKKWINISKNEAMYNIAMSMQKNKKWYNKA